MLAEQRPLGAFWSGIVLESSGEYKQLHCVVMLESCLHVVAKAMHMLFGAIRTLLERMLS